MENEDEPKADDINHWRLWCRKHFAMPERMSREALVKRAWADPEVKVRACRRPGRLAYALDAVVAERGPVCCWK